MGKERTVAVLALRVGKVWDGTVSRGSIPYTGMGWYKASRSHTTME